MARTLRRRPSHRQPKRRILVACEGQETEPNYFDGLRRLQVVRDRWVLKIVPGKGKTPLGTIERAIQRVARAKQRGRTFAFDEVWCVLDVEELTSQSSLAEARRLANEKGFRVALSNPAFEVWILAHFERTAAAFINCDNVIEPLNKHWRREFGEKHQKSDEKVFDRLSRRVTDAIANAKSVREEHFDGIEDTAKCNSSTDVYRLVESLTNPVG